MVAPWLGWGSGTAQGRAKGGRGDVCVCGGGGGCTLISWWNPSRSRSDLVSRNPRAHAPNTGDGIRVSAWLRDFVTSAGHGARGNRCTALEMHALEFGGLCD